MTSEPVASAPVKDAPSPLAAALKALGGIVALAGLVLAAVPTLVSDPVDTPALFEAVERHARWGIAIGLGALFVVHPWRRPWSVLVAWLVFWVSGGYLVARTIGLVAEGGGDTLQWSFFALEVVLCAIAAAWIRHRRDAPDRGA